MVTERTKTILLLTSYFAKNSSKTFKPLSTSEWNRLARWLQTKTINPEDFLTQESDLLLDKFQDKTVTIERIKYLLERKAALALALDKWSKAGVWVINRGDKHFPKQVKDKLKELSPPVFFGIGNIALLNQKYIGVVGSRKTSEEELNATKELGLQISQKGYGVVSGGARGVDESAMIGALEGGGFSLGYVADSLIKKSTSGLFRNHIINNRLCLLSPYNPEAGFNSGNAMGRNKLIYTQSFATIVMKSDVKGGTWEGAKENLQKAWVPLWVVDSQEQGNIAIIKKGGKKFSLKSELDIPKLIKREPTLITPDLFSAPPSIAIQEEIAPEVKREELRIKIQEASFFDLFLLKLLEHFKDKSVTKKELKDTLKLTSSQLDTWLKMGTEKDYLIKKQRPVSFRLNPKLSIRLVS